MNPFEVSPWDERSLLDKLITGAIMGPVLGSVFTISLMLQASFIAHYIPEILNIPPFEAAINGFEESFDNVAEFISLIKLGIVVVCTLLIFQISIAHLLFSNKGVCIKTGFKMIMIWTWFFRC